MWTTMKKSCSGEICVSYISTVRLKKMVIRDMRESLQNVTPPPAEAI